MKRGFSFKMALFIYKNEDSAWNLFLSLRHIAHTHKTSTTWCVLCSVAKVTHNYNHIWKLNDAYFWSWKCSQHVLRTAYLLLVINVWQTQWNDSLLCAFEFITHLPLWLFLWSSSIIHQLFSYRYSKEFFL